MPSAGDRAAAHLQVDPYDLTTLATLAVLGPAPSTPTVYSPDGGHTWLAAVDYPVAGLYRLCWTVTGTGAGPVTQKVAVGPSGAEPATGRRYATSTDLAIRLGDAPPEDADELLRDASELLDRLLLTAVYATDVDGYPTDPELRGVLRDACAEMVRWWIETGDPTGAAAIYSGASMGEISLPRASVGDGRNDPRSLGQRVGPQALAILDRYGLQAGEPWHW